MYENLAKDEPKAQFTIGIVDDVTNHSLEEKPAPDTAPAGTIACKFWGLGGDGTVGANKNSIKIIGDHTDKYIQAYFQYDSKKTGGITISHLRFGDAPIKSPYYINKADFVACHNQAYLHKYDMVTDVKPGGTFLLDCAWTPEELDAHLPSKVKKYIANNNISFYIIDATDIAAKKIGNVKVKNTVLQSAFFALANILPAAEAVEYMKKMAYKSYIKKGQAMVDLNYAAIDAGADAFVKVNVPEAWKTCADDAPKDAATRYPCRSRGCRQQSAGAHRIHGRRQTACFRVLPQPGRYLRPGCRRLREARRRRDGAGAGSPRTASSATPVRSSARTPPSVRSPWTRRRLPVRLPTRALPPSRSSRRPTSTPWLFPRWTAWAAPCASRRAL